jgi:hypothetical protein
MRGLLIVAALAIPLTAAADPAPARPETAPPSAYVVLPPAPMTDSSTGWSWLAGAGGRSLDLQSPGNGWREGGDTGPRDVVAGYVWREQSQSAVFGYSSRGEAPTDGGTRLFAPRPWRDDPDVLGLTLRWQTDEGR